MDASTLSNVAAYTFQMALIVGAATAAHAVLRVPASAVSYVFWRSLLALCLLLPLLQGRQVPSAAVSSGTAVVGEATFTAAAQAVAALPARSIDWAALAGGVLLAGIALRLAWLALTVTRLRRLRAIGRPSGPGEDHADLQRLLGTRADVRYVPELGMPVTFGAFKPVVLLPASLTERPEAIQRAVACHELLHVQRRDWIWRVLEQVVLGIFWFNPAMWWLISRIDLAREAAVDEMAVLATGKRRTYIEALMSFAEQGPSAATAFATRRHLFLRIQSLSREAVMTSARVVTVSAVMMAAVAAGSVYAVNEFPLTRNGAVLTQDAPGPLEQRANRPSRENPMPQRVNYEAPSYPAVARGANMSGSVTMRVTIDESGFVGEARPVGFAFELENPKTNASFSNAQWSDVEAMLQKRVDPPLSATDVQRIRQGVEAFAASASNALRQWRYEPPANGPLTFDVRFMFRPDGEVTASRVSGGRGGFTFAARGAGQESLVSASGQPPLRVGGTIKTPKKIRDVRPVYPPDAAAARVSGMVIIEALIGPDGSVENARVLRSIPLLDEAALDAVMQWRFTPTLLNGVPVPVIMTVTVNFTLDSNGSAGGGLARVAAAASRTNMPRVLHDVKPEYTSEAMRAGIQGMVETEVTIGTDGSVTDARVVRGLPMLNEQALAAVRQWRFEPVAQPVTTTIELTFTLRR